MKAEFSKSLKQVVYLRPYLHKHEVKQISASKIVKKKIIHSPRGKKNKQLNM